MFDNYYWHGIRHRINNNHIFLQLEIQVNVKTATAQITIWLHFEMDGICFTGIEMSSLQIRLWGTLHTSIPLENRY